MKIQFTTLLIFWLFVTACENKNGNLNFSENHSDSLNIYLKLANEDSVSPNIRLDYNRKAFEILHGSINDSLSRAGLFKVANRYYNLNQLDNYNNVSHAILRKAVLVSDTISIAKAYLYIGDYFKNSANTDSAYYYYIKAEKIYRKKKSDDDLATINLKKAEVFWNENDYYGCEFASLESLKYLKHSEDKQKIFEALTMLGIVSNALDDYDKALQYLDKALKIVAEGDLSYNNPYATTLNNIGNVYQNDEQNFKAIQNFEKALNEKNLRKSNPSLYAILVDNLAYSKFKVDGSRKEIIDLFNESIQIKESISYTSGIIFSKTRFAEFYYSQNEISKALQLTNQALLLAQNSGSSTNKLSPLKQLASYDIENSKEFSQEYIRINDSVQQAERKIKDKFARIQFETEEISLQKDKLAEQNRNLLLFFVGTVMIGLLLFVIRTQRAKNRELMLKQAQQKANEDIYNLMLAQQNNIEEGRIKEKKRIAQELHDGVLSRLFGARLNLDSLNKMDGGDAMEKRNNYLTELKNIEQDIREISHDLNREKFVLINNFLAILNNLLEEQAANFEPEVETNIDESIPWDKVNNTLKINLYRITQEALQNINKYANASKIKVTLSGDETNIKLDVSDNGLGFAVDKKSKGIGLQNMVSRAAECDGQLDIKSKKGKGTTISISFPTQTKAVPEPQTTIEPVIA